MGNQLTCDLCKKPMFQDFSDKMYKITIKRLSHSYDGYNPWVRKQKLDVCPPCLQKIVAAT
jgi:hypothetical protein